MKIVKEIIIVEGKHDVAFLSTFLHAQYIITDGTSLPDTTKKQIIELSKDHDFIILTDPDYPGTFIRNELLKIIPNAKIGYIRKHETRKKNTIGVENATKEEILHALDNLISYEEYDQKVTQQDLFDLKLLHFSFFPIHYPPNFN